MKDYIAILVGVIGIVQFGVIIAMWFTIGTGAWIVLFYTWAALVALFWILYIVLEVKK